VNKGSWTLNVIRSKKEEKQDLKEYTEEPVPSFEGTSGRPYEANNCVVTCEETQFCGNDSQCHNTTCSNIYDFRIQDYTHKDETESEELQCVDFAANERDRTFFRNEDIECFGGLNDLPAVVSFKCEISVSGGGSCPNNGWKEKDRPYVPFNRKCTAQTGAQRFFSCYEISPQTDVESYFASYAAEVKALQETNFTCDAANESEYPHHEYANVTVYSYHRQNTKFQGVYSNGIPSDGSSDNFSVTLARMAMLVRSDLLSNDDYHGFPARCAGGCGYDEFCGIDNACHFRNCENFYDFGSSEFTGNKTSESGQLSCFVDSFPEEITPPCADFNGTFPTLVHFTCQPLNIGIVENNVCIGQDSTSDGNRTKGRYAVANRVCRALPNDQQEFHCYDMAPTTNLTNYFQDYVNLVLANPGCDDISYDLSDDINTSWVANHAVESCFIEPLLSDCAHGYRSKIFDPTVMMPPAMHTFVTGTFLADSSSAFGLSSAVTTLWCSLVLFSSLISLGW